MLIKVRDLMEWCQAQDPDKPVVLAKDAEGNGYSPLRKHCEALYRPTSTWSGELLDEDETHPKAIPVIVLWPVN